MESKISKIVFATNNPHKLEEAHAILKGCVEVLSLEQIGCHEEIPETSPTLEGNALIKARWVKDRYGYDCFADDTGLMVDTLDGAPGVYSARFAGPHCSPDDNIALLLDKLKDEENRKARFVTVVALILGDNEYIFEGEVKGEIARDYCGNSGFGYDPVFIPENSDLSFAQMLPEDKNAISHRGRAMKKLAEFISSL